jgi:hypothetical protein
MGTSKSSKGAPSGVPMVPPWVPEPVPPIPPILPVPDAPEDGPPDLPAPPTPETPQQSQPLNPIAPAGRFGTARSSFGSFARTGSSSDMTKGLGRYVSKGWGGGKTAARRLSGTARTAGSLYSAFSGLASSMPTAAGDPLEQSFLNGRTANEITSAVVEAVRPVDGTQDAEATRDAIQGAVSELLAKAPEVDLLNLAEEDRLFVVERFLAIDIFNHLELDIGLAIQNNAPSISAALSRLRELKNYVKQAVAAEFRKILKTGEKLSARRVAAISRQCIQQALEVFEGGAE